MIRCSFFYGNTSATQGNPISMIFTHPAPSYSQHRIFPVFIPFAGCPQRCVFCAQDAQTGQHRSSLKRILAQFTKSLQLRREQKAPPIEVGFYGGTFTALDPVIQRTFLQIAYEEKKRGAVTAIRCSTRPDALSPAWIAQLKELGLDCIELGAQTFHDASLALVNRGHSATQTILAAQAIQEAGLELGIQLLPGLPGTTPLHFKHDMQQVLALKPQHMRLYPCLVLNNTELATWWRQGIYTPWTLDNAVPLLAEALLAAWKEHINVIRIGLAHDANLEQIVLAGAVHPSLGGMVKAEALFLYITEQCSRLPTSPSRLTIPRHLRGQFWGHANALQPRYAALGIRPDTICWHDESWFILE